MKKKLTSSVIVSFGKGLRTGQYFLLPPSLSLLQVDKPEGPGMALSCRRKTSMSLLSSWGACFHDPMHYGQLGMKLPEVLKAVIDSGPEEPLLSGELSVQPL